MKERRFTFTVLAALAILLLVLLAAPAAAADGDVYLIDQFGTTVGTYTSIKAAVNDADEGYTILVSPGTYNETGVEINKENITLKSTGGADVTIIDSRSSVSDPDGTTCLRFSASSFSVEGFTLYSNQNGIYSSIALNNGKITIKDNIIRCYDVDDTSPGHGIGLIVNSAVAAVDTEIEITGNDIAASGRNNAALHLEMNLVRSRVVISNNNISDSYRGIFLSRTVGYPGYEDPEGAKPEHASEVVIENNTIKKISGPGSDITLNGGISVYAVSYGSVHIQGNELVDCRRGIAVGYCGNAGAETDVQILNNKISLSESPPDWNYETAIYVSAPERVFRIEGNTIKGQPGYYYDDGIYLGYIGYYVDKFEGYVLNNEVSYCLKGLTNEDFCLKDGDGSLYVNDNVFTDNDSGIHFKEIYYDEDPDEPYYFMGYLEIKNNVFKNNRGGLVLPVLDYELSPVSVLAEGNLFEGNASGLYLEAETWLGGSEVLIWNNYFKDNESGIDCMKVSPSVKIYLNAFTGNDRGLYYLEGSTLDARFNWWGSPGGPTIEIGSYNPFAATSLAGLVENGGSTTGDVLIMAYEDAVLYDPWLAALELNPASATAKVNSTHTITVSLLDNKDEIVDLADLALAISIAGTHKLDDNTALNLGQSEWGYKGTATGSDEITATVLFAGLDAGLSGKASVTWEAAPVEETDKEESPSGQLPRTDGGFPWLMVGGMLLLAGAGTASRSRRKK